MNDDDLSTRTLRCTDAEDSQSEPRRLPQALVAAEPPAGLTRALVGLWGLALFANEINLERSIFSSTKIYYVSASLVGAG